MLTHITDDDDEFPPLGPTRQQSMASRVSHDESRRSTPPIPPGFEGQLANESRRSTPTVPPGLSRPTALPDLEGSSRPSSRASLRHKSSQILPALPLRPGTPSRATPSRKGTRDESEISLPEETPTKPSRTTSSELKKATSMLAENEAPSTKAPVQEPKEAAVATSGAAQAPSIAADEVEKAGETEKPSTKATETSKSAKASTGKQKAAQEHDVKQTETKPPPATPNKSDSTKADSQKRKHPGKLDITAAVHKQEQENKQEQVGSGASASTGTGKPAQASSQAATSKLPESPSVASPAVKAGPRTLRVVQTPTPKAEIPSHAFPALPNAAAHRLPSRQPSVASINLPGTPSSEPVSMSDNISMASTSQSRANSPPPATSKVGTAPVRAKTKNQMKKERQERAKAIEEEKVKAEEAVKPSQEEPAQEAIVSRKKKTKKEKEPKPPKSKVAPTATAETTPTASRPASPGNKTAVEPAATTEEPANVASKEAKPEEPTKPATPPQPAVQSPAGPSPPPTPTLTAQQLIAELKASAPEIQRCIDSLFRVSNSHQFKTPSNVSHKDLLNGWKSDWNVKLTKEEIDALLSGKLSAVHRGGLDGGQTFDRHLVSPSGAHLRALTKELESRFLELEHALHEMPEELRFRPSKPQNEMKLPSFDLEDLKRKFENSGGRGVSVMEQMVQDGNTMKKGAFLVDEASKYINEFVMPPVTPPPAGARVQQQPVQGAAGHAGISQQATATAEASGSHAIPSVEIAERQLNDAKRFADEKETALRKMIKKNKRMLGLS